MLMFCVGASAVCFKVSYCCPMNCVVGWLSVDMYSRGELCPDYAGIAN